MKKTVREMLPIVEYLCSLSDKEVTLYLRSVKTKVVQFLCDFLLNVEGGQIFISVNVVDELRPSKMLILSLIKVKKSLKARREELTKKGVFHKIFCPLLPVLRSLAK